MITIPVPGSVKLNPRCTLEMAQDEDGVQAMILEMSYLDGKWYSYGPVCRKTKEAAVLDLLVFLQESGTELGEMAARELDTIGKYAVERLCLSLCEEKP